MEGLSEVDRAKAITLLTLAEVWLKVNSMGDVRQCLTDLRAVLEGREGG